VAITHLAPVPLIVPGWLDSEAERLSIDNAAAVLIIARGNGVSTRAICTADIRDQRRGLAARAGSAYCVTSWPLMRPARPLRTYHCPNRRVGVRVGRCASGCGPARTSPPQIVPWASCAPAFATVLGCALTRLRVDTFSRGRALLVQLLGLGAGHALAPPGYCCAVAPAWARACPAAPRLRARLSEVALTIARLDLHLAVLHLLADHRDRREKSLEIPIRLMRETKTTSTARGRATDEGWIKQLAPQGLPTGQFSGIRSLRGAYLSQ
jgi:hypothetical protein